MNSTAPTFPRIASRTTPATSRRVWIPEATALYDVQLEHGTGGVTRLSAHLEAVNLSPDQAEVLGLALVRAGNMLRADPNASDEVKLENYVDGETWIVTQRALLEPTAAERALDGKIGRVVPG